MKKILITSTDLMMLHFLVPHANYLAEKGYDVAVACSNVGGRIEQVYSMLDPVIKKAVVELERKPFRKKNRNGYLQLKRLIGRDAYDLIWTNEPVMGVMTRLAARKTRKAGTVVLYMAHGYHFYKKAPVKNWLYYPVEKIMAHLHDVTVTINWEDYNRTKEKFRVKKVEHIDGIGLYTNHFQQNADGKEVRKRLGIAEDDFLIVSVGELKKRKNHQAIIRAIARTGDRKIKYVICGEGELFHALIRLSRKEGVEGQVTLAGYRTDIPEILKAADIAALPSLREGLGIAGLEAMASGLALVASNVQGIPDYIVNGRNGFTLDPFDYDGFAKAILRLKKDEALRRELAANNLTDVMKYDIQNSRVQVEHLIRKYTKKHSP